MTIITDDELKNQITKIDVKLEPEILDNEVKVIHPQTNMEMSFSFKPETKHQVLEDIKEFADTVFIENQGIYRDDYFEVLIGLSETNFVSLLIDNYDFSIPKTEGIEDNIHYEITEKSDLIDSFIMNNISEYGGTSIASLKIYNINKILSIKISDLEYLSIAFKIAKTIIFNISQKTSLNLQFIDIEEYDDGPIYDAIEKAKTITRTIVEDRYDKDLLDYYYRAIQMENSEFKYLAFYQVIECIFDEVYLHETVQDVIKIIEGNSFTTTDKSNIKDLIDVVNQYNKDKDDRNKTKLVIEKYFKGDVHNEAFIISNKELIDILITDIKMIKEKNDLLNLQNIANIIYNYRCKCTHSNREYPIERNYNSSKEELDNYIKVIKLISEKIILNYSIVK